jgi:hypothetical protein
MLLREVSFIRSDQELQRRMALKAQKVCLLEPSENHQEEQERPVNALRGLLDAIPERPKAKRPVSALRGVLGISD